MLVEIARRAEALGFSTLGTIGRVGFPTFVNNRRAYFSWQPGEDNILYWNYAGDDHRQAIPVSWLKQANLTVASRR